MSCRGANAVDLFGKIYLRCYLHFACGYSTLKAINDMNLHSHIEKGIITNHEPFPMCEFFV